MKKLMMPLMVVLMIIGWVNTINSLGKTDQVLEQHMAQAEIYESKGIYIDALEEYKKVLNYTKDPFPIHLKIMDMYANLNKYSDFVDYGEDLLVQYKYPQEVVMKLVDYYKESEKKRYAIDVLKRANANAKDNEIYYQELAALRGTYTNRYLGKDSVSAYFNGFAVYEKEGLFGLIDKEGDDAVKAIYQVITPYAKDPELATVKRDDLWFCIDSSGYRKLIPDQEVEELGMFGEGYISFKSKGSYGYMDREMQIVKEPEWDYGGVFSGGMAPVKKGEKWAFIDKQFQLITDYIYDDIVISEHGIATETECYFAKQNGKYYLFNRLGEKLEQRGFDQAYPFVSTQPAAVCRDKKWGFIDQNGTMIIKPQYDNAMSFSCELAPVEIDEKWGFIDLSNTVRILPEFEEVRVLSDNGSAPALSRNWGLITLIQ